MGIITHCRNFIEGHRREYDAVRCFDKSIRAIALTGRVATIFGLSAWGAAISKSMSLRGLAFTAFNLRDLPLLFNGRLLNNNKSMVIKVVSILKIGLSTCWLASSYSQLMKTTLPIIGFGISSTMSVYRSYMWHTEGIELKEKIRIGEGVLDSIATYGILSGLEHVGAVAGLIAALTHLINYWLVREEKPCHAAASEVSKV